MQVNIQNKFLSEPGQVTLTGGFFSQQESMDKNPFDDFVSSLNFWWMMAELEKIAFREADLMTL